jgi:hypothetical protein
MRLGGLVEDRSDSSIRANGFKVTPSLQLASLGGLVEDRSDSSIRANGFKVTPSLQLASGVDAGILAQRLLIKDSRI